MRTHAVSLHNHTKLHKYYCRRRKNTIDTVPIGGLSRVEAGTGSPMLPQDFLFVGPRGGGILQPFATTQPWNSGPLGVQAPRSKSKTHSRAHFGCWGLSQLLERCLFFSSSNNKTSNLVWAKNPSSRESGSDRRGQFVYLYFCPYSNSERKQSVCAPTGDKMIPCFFDREEDLLLVVLTWMRPTMRPSFELYSFRKNRYYRTGNLEWKNVPKGDILLLVLALLLVIAGLMINCQSRIGRFRMLYTHSTTKISRETFSCPPIYCMSKMEVTNEGWFQKNTNYTPRLHQRTISQSIFGVLVLKKYISFCLESSACRWLRKRKWFERLHIPYIVLFGNEKRWVHRNGDSIGALLYDGRVYLWFRCYNTADNGTYTAASCVVFQ